MDFFVSLNLSIQFVLTHRSNPFSAKILLQAPSTDPLKKAICGDRAVPGERSSTPALTGPPFLTPEKIQPNCTIYMGIQKIYILIMMNIVKMNFTCPIAPDCAVLKNLHLRARSDANYRMC